MIGPRVTVAVPLVLALLLALVPAAPALADREYSWTLDKDNQELSAPLPYVYDF